MRQHPLLRTLVWMLGAVAVLASAVPAAALANTTTAEPTLAQRRAQVQQQLANDERACGARFAVNDCLRAARDKHRPALEALRQQELDQTQRARFVQAQTRLNNLQDKASAAREPANPRARALPAVTSSAPSVREQQAAQRAAAARTREQAQQTFQREHALKLEQGTTREKQYHDRQREAERHRLEVQQRQDKVAPRAPALPPAP